MNNNFYKDIQEIKDAIEYIEDNNREYGYEIDGYILEIPRWLNELLIYKSRYDEGYIISEEYKPCVMCGKPINIIEVCSEGHFCSKECENKFMEEMIKHNE